MDFKQIDAFVNVARYKSFSKAAEAIYLSQPTVSAHIATLEEELGTLLFDRHGKDIRLTTAGELFLEYATNMINLRNNAILNISELDTKITGNLVIATSTVPLRTLLPSLIAKFHRLYGGSTFDLREASTQHVVQQLLAGEADIGFVGEVLPDEKLAYTKVKQDELILISGDPELPEQLSLAQLQMLPLIIRENGSATRHLVDTFVKTHELAVSDFKASAVVSTLEGVLQLVKAGFGISIVPEAACSDYLAAGLIRKHRLETSTPQQVPLLTQDFYMITPIKRTMSPVAKAFLKHVLEHCPAIS